MNSIASEIVALLAEQGKTLAVAESFTGGGIASAIVAVPGASKVFVDGVVCYSHEAKIKRLGVSTEVIEKYGAVSEITARAMVGALLGSMIAPDYAIATTGNAGPGAEEKSELGECYVAIASVEKIAVFKLSLSGGRQENISFGISFALEKFLEFVKN
jgi:PncC family amidohydrolase